MILRYNRFLVFLLVVCCLVNGVCASAQQHSYGRGAPAAKASNPGISIRTNLLWDGVAEPNIGLEVAVGKHLSLGVNAGIKPWRRWLAWDNDSENNPTHWRNFAIVPELRYYPRQTYDGWFLGADLLYTHFNVSHIGLPFNLYPELRNNRLQGDFYAGGLFVGYSWWLGKHWRLELEAGAAVGLAQYEQYNCGFCGSKVGEEKRIGIAPKLGLNIAWNPKARVKRKK